MIYDYSIAAKTLTISMNGKTVTVYLEDFSPDTITHLALLGLSSKLRHKVKGTARSWPIEVIEAEIKRLKGGS